MNVSSISVKPCLGICCALATFKELWMSYLCEGRADSMAFIGVSHPLPPFSGSQLSVAIGKCLVVVGDLE